MGFLDQLGITTTELEEAIQSSASLRGILIGYIAERKLCEMWFRDLEIQRYDNHDRTRKGDRWITYKGKEISIEVKSLQTTYTRQVAGGWAGRFQVDASDRRPVTLPNGGLIETTCLVVGEFDLLAINLFDFGQKWRFAFAKNTDLPRSPSRRYTP